MAAGFADHLAAGRVQVSGGSERADDVNPMAVAAMAEVGIDIAAHSPRRWSDTMMEAADVVITTGCDDTCPVFPGKRYVDWEPADPAGLDLEAVRPIRDDLEARVRDLLRELGALEGG